MSDSHNPHDDMVPATFADEPIANPGLPAHQWRPTDVDPKAEKRAERQVAGLFGLAFVSAILFLVSYFVFQIGEDTSTFGGLGPVSEGLFAWLVGLGALVGFAVWIAAHTTRSTKEKVEA